jgi:alcohol dehydrogenase
MRAIVYARHGGPEELALCDLPDPVPEAGEVRVRVRAVALNGFDPMMLEGTTGLKVPFPMVPCGDLAGEIDALGPGVEGWSVGDRVSVYPILPVRGMMGETTLGGACELVCVPASVLIAVPDAVSFTDAAALPVAYGTALRMIETRGAVRAGERVLVLGAGGGVGVAAIQFASALGAHVIAGASGAAKAARLLEIGAAETLDTADPHWRKVLVARHGKPAFYGPSGGMDVIVNYVGGATWTDSLKVLGNGGRILVCGASAGHDPVEDLRYIWSFEQSVIGSNGWSVADQAELLRRVANGQLRPVIHSTGPLGSLPDAMRALAGRQVIGKAVITL